MNEYYKKYFPKGWIVQIFLFVGLLYGHYLNIGSVVILNKPVTDKTIIGFVVFTIALLMPLRFFTTTYVIKGDKFIYTRLFGLLRTEAYLANILEYREYSWLISNWIQLYTYHTDPKKNHKYKIVFIAMRQKNEAEFIKCILEHNPNLRMEPKFYKMLQKYYGKDFGQNKV